MSITFSQTATGFSIVSIVGDYNTALTLSFSGDDLALDSAGQLTGAITDFDLFYAFDNDALSAAAGEPITMDDQLFYEGIGVDFAATLDVQDGQQVNLFMASFLVAYGQSKAGYAEGLSPVTTLLGGSSLSKGYGAEDNIIHTYGDDVSLTLRGGQDTVRVMDGGGDLSARMGGGNDVAHGGAGNDSIWGNFGDDTLNGGGGDDRLLGGYGDDVLFGAEGDDRLVGGVGHDVIRAGTGADVLNGGAGRDVLIAADDGATWDVMIGGAGADAFVFTLGPQADVSGRVLIRDFEAGQDMLWSGPSNNGTWTAEQAYDLFMDGARQVGDRVVYQDGDYRVVLLDVALGDITVDSFVDGPSGGYYAWADMA